MGHGKTGAIAIFVKTPGLSPIKTRLGSAIGAGAAEQFHLLSARAVESVVVRAAKQGNALTPYWAVAEKEALDSPHWGSFQNLWQGEGSLGERLARVYEDLIEKHAFVMFIGADSPQLTSRLLAESALILSQAADPTFVLGRAYDGGFYLLGGRSPVPREVWLDVPYSAPTTASELAKRVERLGRLVELPMLLDVDTVDGMARLLPASAGNLALSLEQRALLKWVRNFFEVRK